MLSMNVRAAATASGSSVMITALSVMVELREAPADPTIACLVVAMTLACRFGDDSTRTPFSTKCARAGGELACARTAGWAALTIRMSPPRSGSRSGASMPRYAPGSRRGPATELRGRLSPQHRPHLRPVVGQGHASDDLEPQAFIEGDIGRRRRLQIRRITLIPRRFQPGLEHSSTQTPTLRGRRNTHRRQIPDGIRRPQAGGRLISPRSHFRSITIQIGDLVRDITESRVQTRRRRRRPHSHRSQII